MVVYIVFNAIAIPTVHMHICILNENIDNNDMNHVQSAPEFMDKDSLYSVNIHCISLYRVFQS